ncbi:MAG: hypothetical protein TH68_01120 [Candidatus Synechococcus spongiarum 142]|uniref:Uncharacterized protein n=1 Tax=Candidatus Synechococcus spongiarum 142 TaxID=1608213 RepID=A0A6N3X875_9SYNE|nr:MAG: hypothetical protein TH68_01120 [Candidatus Synechococcus spongiarum 142]
MLIQFGLEAYGLFEGDQGLGGLEGLRQAELVMGEQKSCLGQCLTEIRGLRAVRAVTSLIL